MALQTSKNVFQLSVSLIIAGGLIGAAILYTHYKKPAPPTADIHQVQKEDEKGQQSDQNKSQEDAIKEIMNDLENDPFFGSAEAPVTIVGYSSFFCPHCKRFDQETLPLLKKKYINSGKVRYYFRSFPPVELSEAILCANEQGKFKEYSDYLFEKAKEIKKIEDLNQFAQELGLNDEEFSQCLTSKKYETRAIKWYQEAQGAGITGTPTFLINGQKIVGNQPVEIFEKAIDIALNNSQNK